MIVLMQASQVELLVSHMPYNSPRLPTKPQTEECMSFITLNK